MENAKVCLVVDAGYFISTQKNTGSIDLLKFKKLIEKMYGKVSRGFYVTSIDNDNQKGFHKWLQSVLGPKLEVVVKGQKIKNCNNCGHQIYIEKGVDVALVILAIKNAEYYDKIVLVNGDSDLLDALVYIRDVLKKDIIIAGEISSISTETQSIATDVLLLSDHIEEIRANN